MCAVLCQLWCCACVGFVLCWIVYVCRVISDDSAPFLFWSWCYLAGTVRVALFKDSSFLSPAPLSSPLPSSPLTITPANNCGLHIVCAGRGGGIDVRGYNKGQMLAFCLWSLCLMASYSLLPFIQLPVPLLQGLPFHVCLVLWSWTTSGTCPVPFPHRQGEKKQTYCIQYKCTQDGLPRDVFQRLLCITV